MIKVKLEGHKELQKELDQIDSGLSALQGQILEKERMLPDTKVADSDLNALYDALYIAKRQQDEVKISSILDEISNFNVPDEEIINAIINREADNFLDSIF